MKRIGQIFKPDGQTPKNTGSAWVAVTVLTVAAAMFLGREVLQPVRLVVWHAASLTWFAVILIAAWGQGRAVVGLIAPRQEDTDPAVRSMIAVGTGLGLLSLEAFFLAAVGLMNTAALTALVTVVFALTAARWRRLATGLGREGQSIREATSGSRLPLSLAGLAVLVSWPFVLVPARAFDALSYHLEVPLRYLQAGRIIDIPENLYSYTPQLNHTLYGLALGLSGSDLAGLLNHLYFVLALAMLWLGFRDRFGAAGGAWAAAVSALSPLLLVEVANTGVDWSAAFYTLSVLSLLAAGTDNRGRVVLAGIMAGLAVGCRHQPLGYAVVIPAVVWILDDLVSRRRVRGRNLGTFLVLAAAVGSPWYIRNWIFTGDPLFPLLSNLAGRTDAGSGFVSGFIGAKSPSLLWKWAVLPLKMVFDPLTYSMTATIGVQYLVLLPLLAVRKWRAPRNRFLLWWLILAFLAWYLNFRAARYAMPVLLLAALWLGTSLAGATRSPKGWSRALVIAVASALLVNAGVFVGIQDRVNRSVGAALGMVSSSRYLTETCETYPAIDYLNKRDPAPGRVLFVGEMRGFYSRFPREVPSHNRPNRLLEMVKRGLPPGTMARELSGAGFTHLLVNRSEWWRMAYRNRNAPAWRFVGEQKARFNEFLRAAAKAEFSSGPVTVYRLTPEGPREGDG